MKKFNFPEKVGAIGEAEEADTVDEQGTACRKQADDLRVTGTRISFRYAVSIYYLSLIN